MDRSSWWTLLGLSALVGGAAYLYVIEWYPATPDQGLNIFIAVLAVMYGFGKARSERSEADEKARRKAVRAEKRALSQR